MSQAKAKGTRAESLIVDYLKTHGWPHAERHAQHGSKDIGDINIGPGIVIESKACKRIDLAGWLRELADELDNAQGGDGVIVWKAPRKSVEDWPAIMPFGKWCEMAKEAGL